MHLKAGHRRLLLPLADTYLDSCHLPCWHRHPALGCTPPPWHPTCSRSALPPTVRLGAQDPYCRPSFADVVERLRQLLAPTHNPVCRRESTVGGGRWYRAASASRTLPTA